MTSYALRVCAVAAAALATNGCDPWVCCAAPQPGYLRVTTVTTGVNIDPDGFTLVTTPQIAGRDSLTRPIAVNTTVTVGLEPTGQTVRLKDLQSNCTVVGDNPRFITITVRDTAAATFTVSCT
jgi:hypothetical protein